jgi:putative membrane protein
MRYYILLFIKGMAMGIANVIPGVSGGTIALITNIYEEFITSLKSFNIYALKLLLKGKIKKFISYTNVYFLLIVFGGSIISVFSIAKLFKFLFNNYPVLIWAFFFGLIIASIYYVGKRINTWDIKNIAILILATIITFSISFIEPANQNDNLFFIFICGIIGIVGMMLPGLSGSFILILLGNYELLLVDAIIELNYRILSIFILGSITGLIVFSNIISWLLNKHKDKTLSLLTGFILGSLFIIWPWKKKENTIIIDGVEKILSYSWHIPTNINTETISALILMTIGVFTVYYIEKLGNK